LDTIPNREALLLSQDNNLRLTSMMGVSPTSIDPWLRRIATPVPLFRLGRTGVFVVSNERLRLLELGRVNADLFQIGVGQKPVR
jgi:hypothetical protein